MTTSLPGTALTACSMLSIGRVIPCSDVSLDKPQPSDVLDTVPDHETSEDLLPPEDPFQPGTSIGHVWVVQSRLGKGGMGSVYRCNNRHASKIVAAIKGA